LRGVYVEITTLSKFHWCFVATTTGSAITTGDHEFAVCPRHTAKTRRHTAKTSPTVADGSHGDGKDRVCRVPIVGHTAKLYAVCISRHTAKKKLKASPCAGPAGTQQSSWLRRVLSFGTR